MWTHGAPNRKPEVIGICIYAFGTVVNFVFGEAIETRYPSGRFPEVVARAEWAFSVSNHGIH